MIWYLRILAALVLACGVLCAPASIAADICSAHVLTVRITDPGPADQTLHGQLCQPPGRMPRTVQLLVHGAAYNHVYWDFPVKNDYYSFVKVATAAGYATFNVDRIGSGDSSHPFSKDLTVPAGAVAMHDVITALRSGAIGGHAFRRVIWVGHSLGSGLAWWEAPRYQDVDGVVLTSFLHVVNPTLESHFYPATEDPKFANSGLDSGYLTTKPNTRGSSYYYPDTTEPEIVAADEANKDVTTLNPVSLPPQIRITAPVLLVVGQKDDVFCINVTQYDCTNPESIRSYESQYYLPEAHLKAETIPLTGHNVGLSTTAPSANAIIIKWALSTVAP